MRSLLHGVQLHLVLSGPHHDDSGLLSVIGVSSPHLSISRAILVQRYHSLRLSVRPSICPSVCLYISIGEVRPLQHPLEESCLRYVHKTRLRLSRTTVVRA